MLSEVPGIIDAAMTITPNPDGGVTLRVLIGSGGDAGRDLIELIIKPEHVQYALGSTTIRTLAAGHSDERAPTFPCHVGLSHITP
ncbi:MAG: hypothetical protein ABSA53_10075 [Streptosporangiaceae bacterium]|jgi:hypothetical protein